MVGRNAGVGVIGGVKLQGWIAWFIWLLLHSMNPAQALNRVVVFVRWGYQYLTFYRAGLRLITGDDDFDCYETGRLAAPLRKNVWMPQAPFFIPTALRLKQDSP